jgi:putative thioredoxin
MERSLEVPVVVDFWAEWCGPCKTLGPVLEKLAEEYGGAFELVKVDVDKNPRIAQAFRVQSIPLVYAFVGGQPVDGFQGAIPPAEVKKFIERLVPAPEKSALEVAREAVEANDLVTAKAAFEAVLRDKPDPAAAGEAHIGLARVALAARDAAGATVHLEPDRRGRPAVHAGAAPEGRARLQRGRRGRARPARDAITADPKNVESWYRLGATLATQLRYEDALDCFLKVVGLDRAYRDDAGRKRDAQPLRSPRRGARDVDQVPRRLAALLF